MLLKIKKKYSTLGIGAFKKARGGPAGAARLSLESIDKMAGSVRMPMRNFRADAQSHDLPLESGDA